MAGNVVFVLALCFLAVKADEPSTTTPVAAAVTTEGPRPVANVAFLYTSDTLDPFYRRDSTDNKTKGFLVDLVEELVRRVDKRTILSSTEIEANSDWETAPSTEKLHFIAAPWANYSYRQSVYEMLFLPYLRFQLTAVVRRDSGLNTFDEILATKPEFQIALIKDDIAVRGDSPHEFNISTGQKNLTYNLRTPKEALEFVRNGSGAFLVDEFVGKSYMLSSANCDLKLVTPFPPQGQYVFGFPGSGKSSLPYGFDQINKTLKELDASFYDGLKKRHFDSPCSTSLIAATSVMTLLLVATTSLLTV